MKTHYEIITDTACSTGDTFRKALHSARTQCGEHFTIPDLITSPLGIELKRYILDSPMSASAEGIISTHFNMLYHVHYFERSHKQIYEITPDLAYMLHNTHLSKVQPELFKSPYNELLLIIPNGLFTLTVPVTGDHILYNIYVNFVERSEKEKEIRLFCVGKANNKSTDPYDDACYFFRIKTTDSDTDLFEIVEREIEEHTNSDEILARMNNIKSNVVKTRDIFNFVCNCLLYITGADCSFVRRDDASMYLTRADNAKKKKWLKRASTVGLPRYVVGSDIVLSREDKEHYIALHSDPTVKRSPMHRTLVQGHWRQQAYSTGFKKRKLLWIKPFWKGLQFGDIITRKRIVR
jgi:hypothetical protein